MADMSATLRIDRLLERLYGQEECERSFGALHTLDARQEGALRTLMVTRIGASGASKVDKEELKADIITFLKATPALDEGFHSPEVLLHLLMQDASSPEPTAVVPHG